MGGADDLVVVAFTATVQPGTADAEVSWELAGPESADAELRHDETFSVALTTPGTYTVTATARQDGEASVQDERVLVVREPEPPPEVTEPPDEPEPPPGVAEPPDETEPPPGVADEVEEAGPSEPENASPRETGPTDEGQVVTRLELRLAASVLQALPPSGFSTIGIGDLSGDGRPDLVAGSSDHPRVTLFRARPDGTCEFVRTVSAELVPERLLVADFTGNGLGDILVINWTTGRANLFLAQGPFQVASALPLRVPATAWAAWAGGVDDTGGSSLVWLTDRGPVVWGFHDTGQVVEWASPPAHLSYPLPSAQLYSWVELDEGVSLVSYDARERQLVLITPSGRQLLAHVPSGVSFHALAASADLQGNKITLMGLDQLGRLHTLRFVEP